MAFFLSPVLNEQQFDANGDPRAGALIETYLAGTLTPVITYKTSTGTAHTNPIQLDSSGNYPNGTQLWLLGGLTYKLVITDSNGANSRTYDNISGIGDNANTADEWILYAAAPTYIGATSFSVAGDQTNIFQVSRRVKSTNTGGTVYSTISNSVFAAGITTVTVVNTSGVLDSGLSQVSYGILAPLNPSFPNTIVTAGADSKITSLNGLTTPVSLIALRSYLAGCTLSTAGGSGTMSIAAGAAMDSTNAYLMQLAATSKTTSAWAVGAAVGGLDTGAIAASTYYHWFVIRRPDTGVVDVLFSLSPTAPTLPANYTQFRRIGSIKTTAGSLWTSFIQDGNLFQLVTAVVDSTTIPAAATLRTLSTPTGVNVIARVAAQISNTSGSMGAATHWDPSLSATAPSTLSGAVQVFNASVVSQSATGILDIRTNTSAQIYNAGNALTGYALILLAWTDSRGRDA